jgi:hypothetical protein
MASDLNIIMFLFRILNPFQAYLLNSILIHTIAFIGMYLFINRYLLFDQDPPPNSNVLCLAVSFAFAILPFYTMHGLSVAGIPLLLFAFLNIAHKEGKLLDYLIIIFFPFYSSLFIGGTFLIIGLFLTFLFFLIVNNRFIWQALLAWLLFSALFLIVEHDFLQISLFGGDFISHRTEWNLEYLGAPIRDVFIQVASMFIRGQYHAPSFQLTILLTSLLAVVIGRAAPLKKLILVILALQLIIAIIYGLYMWDKLIPLKTLLGIFSSFNWSRTHMLSPFVWYCVFFLSLIALSKQQGLGGLVKHVLIISVLIVQITVNIIHNPEYGSYIYQYVRLSNVTSEKITYRQFFSENLFAKISQTIGVPKEDYRVVSIGIHPSIAQYNGFYTLDGYQNFYPLAYKQQFRKLIARELEKNKTWQEYFDYWGSRCYLFSSEIPDLLSTKDKGRVINHLEIDTQVFQEMGGQYIFSAAEIMNSAAENLTTIGLFEDKDSVWRIYVYGIGE